MNRNIKYIWNGMTYQELKAVIQERRKIRSFPLVDNPSLFLPICISICLFLKIIFVYLDHMILLGSVQREELIELLKRHIGHERRQKVAAQRLLDLRSK